MKKKIFFGICILLFFILAIPVKSDLKQDIIAYYSFDYNATDSGNNSYDGIVSGATHNSTGGILRGDYDFDGSNDFINTTIPPSTGFRSISFWFKQKDTSADELIGGAIYNPIEQSGDFMLRARCDDGQNRFLLKYYKGSGGANEVLTWGCTNICDNAWHHIVVIANNFNNQTNLYCDGNLTFFDSSYDGGTFSGADEQMYIGRSGDNGAWRYSEGSSDEWAFYSIILTQQNITDLYNSGIGYNPFEIIDIPPNITDNGTNPISPILFDTVQYWVEVRNETNPISTVNIRCLENGIELFNNTNATYSGNYIWNASVFVADISNIIYNCSVIAEDTSGLLDNTSLTFSVSNIIPNITKPIIINTPIVERNNLNCSIVPTDKENTTLEVEFFWIKNDTIIEEWNSSVLCANNSACGTGELIPYYSVNIDDSFICSARVSDGFDWSDWSNSTNETAIPQPSVEDEFTLTTQSCPIGSTAEVLMFSFLFFMLVAMFIISETLLKIPFFSMIIGLGFMIFAFSVFGCSAILGVIVAVFGLGMIISKVF